jgi:glutamine amidotransferase
MNRLRLAVVDYGAGNLRSVARALEVAGASPHITGDPADVASADALVMPGQGSCNQAMDNLRTKSLEVTVLEAIKSGKPFLGVCLGLEVLLDSTEEGNARCLGVIPGRVHRLPPSLKVPHMGWNQVRLLKEHPVFQGIPQQSHFYFVHSFYAAPKDANLIAATTDYGFEFCCAIAQGNMVATQFHPEKSGALGLKLYENFVRFAARANQGGS